MSNAGRCILEERKLPMRMPLFGHIQCLQVEQWMNDCSESAGGGGVTGVCRRCYGWVYGGDGQNPCHQSGRHPEGLGAGVFQAC